MEQQPDINHFKDAVENLRDSQLSPLGAISSNTEGKAISIVTDGLTRSVAGQLTGETDILSMFRNSRARHLNLRKLLTESFCKDQPDSKEL